MSAEELRAAARLMRERAESAGSAREFPSPWSVGREYGTFDVLCHDDQSGLVVEHLDEVAAEHIASWHPAVALAVAAWLEACAEFEAHMNRGADPESDSWRWRPHQYEQALTVARTYLGAT